MKPNIDKYLPSPRVLRLVKLCSVLLTVEQGDNRFGSLLTCVHAFVRVSVCALTSDHYQSKSIVYVSVIKGRL